VASLLRDRADYLRERVNTSVWPIPVAFCIGSLGLALLMLWIDRWIIDLGLELSVFAMEPSAARQVLAVVAGSIISVGGVAFSVIMVALTLTSGQYGPKVLRRFLDDNASKVTLGLFLGTYVYTLVSLAGFGAMLAASLTVLVSLLLALAALLGFVQLIHRTATDLQADQIVQDIGKRLEDALTRLTAKASNTQRQADTVAWRRAARGMTAHDVAATHRGYAQSVDHAGLVAWCVEHDCRLQVRVRAGDFLVPGVRAFRLHAPRVADREEAEAVVQALNGHIIVGPMRTAVQDPEYIVTQLNQLAARALSPGINDPETAITCIDWFSLALAEIADRDLPGAVFCDADGKPRLIARTVGYAGLLDAVYAPLRQMAAGDVQVSIRLLASLQRLATLTYRPARLAALCGHGELIVDAVVERHPAASDLREIQTRYRRLLAASSLSHGHSRGA
jgi:uncharacterized membrane protein